MRSPGDFGSHYPKKQCRTKLSGSCLALDWFSNSTLLNKSSDWRLFALPHKDGKDGDLPAEPYRVSRREKQSIGLTKAGPEPQCHDGAVPNSAVHASHAS